MFTSRFNFTVTLFILLIVLWANYYFKFGPMAVKSSAEVETAKSAVLFDTPQKIAFHPLVATGDASPDKNGEIFGLIKDTNGKILNDSEAGKETPYICHNGAGPDHTSLLQKEGQLFAVTQLECSIGGAYISRLSQDPEGALSVEGFDWVDFSSVGGTAVGCAGVTTPWQSHLGSEEYENDMRSATEANPSIAGALRYLGLQATEASVQKLGYNQGWITEITPVDAKGRTKVAKHYAMGRFSHELAFVMPDEKTVYLSDDGTNGAFFMFIADEKRNFDAGTLYAARWHQQQDAEAIASLEWISLGHSEQKRIRRYLDAAPSFGDLFEESPFKEGCPQGFTSVNTAKAGPLCLKVKPGKEEIASRLESRRYAAIKGATTEFQKSEGLTYDPQARALYLSTSVLSRGMEDHAKDGAADRRYDEGGRNDIRLRYNPCGMILKFALQKGSALGSEFVVSKVSKLIEGVPKNYPKVSKEQYNSCDITTPANPDNISMLPGSPYLAIGEDSKGHEQDRLWLLNTQTKVLQEIAKAPLGAEFTSTYWHRDINGYSYLISVIQHPYGEKDWLVDHTKAEVTEAAKHSVVGYFGPFKF